MRQIDASLSSLGNGVRMSGDVSGVHIAPPEDPQLHAYVVRFEPCGCTAWHSHDRGQLLICTDGAGFVGTRDGNVIELRPSIAVWTDAGEDHWHGAGPDSAMTHVAVQTETPDGDSVTWKELVTELPWQETRR